jgi:hypothetical protein
MDNIFSSRTLQSNLRYNALDGDAIEECARCSGTVLGFNDPVALEKSPIEAVRAAKLQIDDRDVPSVRLLPSSVPLPL